MPGPSAPMHKKLLSLTKEEAFALLEMCAVTLVPERPAHLLVLSRLSSLCRELLQTQSMDGETPPEGHAVLTSSCPSGECRSICCSC
jgi:hypothetical protein